MECRQEPITYGLQVVCSICNRVWHGSLQYFFSSPSLLKPLHKIQNDALRLCTGAMASTPVICVHHACDEMPLNINHRFQCLKFKAHLLSFNDQCDHPTLALIEDCWFVNIPFRITNRRFLLVIVFRS